MRVQQDCPGWNSKEASVCEVGLLLLKTTENDLKFHSDVFTQRSWENCLWYPVKASPTTWKCSVWINHCYQCQSQNYFELQPSQAGCTVEDKHSDRANNQIMYFVTTGPERCSGCASGPKLYPPDHLQPWILSWTVSCRLDLPNSWVLMTPLWLFCWR